MDDSAPLDDDGRPLAFDGFRLLTRLTGQGSAGLWQARRLQDGVMVAIKVFDAADAARAEREAEIAATIGHPHIVAPLGSAVAEDAVGLVLPWYPAGSLAELIAVRHRLRWPEVLTVLIPLADALAAAHERGFVHGDVSLANVLFDAAGRPLLSDFGAARAATEAGAEVYATACDVAPEIVRGAAPSSASDLFSLGSVALACLTGRSAWFADDLQDVLIQSTAGQWPDLEDHMAPEVLRVLIRRLLSPGPADRGGAAALAVDLRRVGQPEPVELVPWSGRGVTVRAATVVRPDALRPPAADWQPPAGAARLRLRAAGLGLRRLAGTLGSRMSFRGAVAAVAVLALAGGALVFGWASSGTPAGEAAPAVVIDGSGAGPDDGAVVVIDQGGPASGDVRAVVIDKSVSAVDDDESEAGTASTVVSVPGAAADEQVPGPGEEDGPTAGASDDDWLGVVTRLDEARAAALVARDETLLGEVYAPGARAREQDAERIATMLAAGVQVRAATHVVSSVALVDLHPGGGVTLEVTQSQASATVYDDGGTAVGSTPAAPESTRLVRLEPAEGGFRISRIDAP